MRTEFLCIAVLTVASGPRAKLAGRKSALNSRWWFILLTVRRCGPGFILSLCCFVVYPTRRFVLNLTLCYFVLVFFTF